MNETKSGMWFFLAAEALFFAGFFLAYAVYRYWYGSEFIHASRHMNVWLGTINTAVLLASSYAMASAVEKGFKQTDRSRALRWLYATFFLGAVFLAVKFYEYYEKGSKGLLSGLPNHRADIPPTEDLFINLYLGGTGFHALHMIGGLIAVLVVIYYCRKRGAEEMLPTAHRLALYWHFVDIVWIFLYPSFYLLGGKS